MGKGRRKNRVSRKRPKAYNKTVRIAMDTTFSSLIITTYNVIDIIKGR